MALNPFNLLKSALWRTAFAMRETGKRWSEWGARYKASTHMRTSSIAMYQWRLCSIMRPTLGTGAFVAPSGMVLGKVALGAGSSVWYNATVRGDYGPVIVGKGTNIQDNAYIGAVSEFSPSVSIGDNVSIGHGAVLKGCTHRQQHADWHGRGDLRGRNVGSSSIVAAGAYVEEDAVVPPNEVWAGNPAQKLRDLKPSEKDYLRSLPGRYIDMAAQHQEMVELLELKQDEYSR